jgi:methionyl-tRNA synthetase
MSKSVGNVIDPFALADAYGVDQLRYFFLREVPFGQDGNYSHEAIVNRINADLANDLGNLAQRSLSMVARQLGGVLPKPGPLSGSDQEILAAADGMMNKAREAMKTQQLHQVLNAVWAVVAQANRYFAGEALGFGQDRSCPARDGPPSPRSAAAVAILSAPFMPASASKLPIFWLCRRASGNLRHWRCPPHPAWNNPAGAKRGVSALCRERSDRLDAMLAGQRTSPAQ